MTYAYPSRECRTGLQVVTLLRLEKKVSHAVENFVRRTVIRGFRVNFKRLSVYNYNYKLTQAEVIRNHENAKQNRTWRSPSQKIWDSKFIVNKLITV